MRLALGQINPTVGDLSGNVSKMLDYAARALEGKAQAVIFPELSLNGYPPRDLVEKPSFLTRTEDALQINASLYLMGKRETPPPAPPRNGAAL